MAVRNAATGRPDRGHGRDRETGPTLHTTQAGHRRRHRRRRRSLRKQRETKMKYELYEGDTKRDAVVEDLEDNFAAETWAKGWVRENAKGDRYTLRRDDGAL